VRNLLASEKESLEKKLEISDQKIML